MGTDQQMLDEKFWWRRNQGKSQCAEDLKAGSVCPICQKGRLAYDGLFILSCPHCGYVATAGAFT